LGNSRPDRALFEAIPITGLRVLVCRPSVLQRQKESSFVVRKLNRSGHRVVWEEDTYLAHIDNLLDRPAMVDPLDEADSLVPVLATDSRFRELSDLSRIASAYPAFASETLVSDRSFARASMIQ
jgi:hypothetical protein